MSEKCHKRTARDDLFYRLRLSSVASELRRTCLHPTPLDLTPPSRHEAVASLIRRKIGFSMARVPNVADMGIQTWALVVRKAPHTRRPELVRPTSLVLGYGEVAIRSRVALVAQMGAGSPRVLVL